MIENELLSSATIEELFKMDPDTQINNKGLICYTDSKEMIKLIMSCISFIPNSYHNISIISL